MPPEQAARSSGEVAAATFRESENVNSEAADHLRRSETAGAVQGKSVPAGLDRRLLAFVIDSVALSVCIFSAATLSWITVGAAISFDLTQPGPDNGLLTDLAHVRITAYVSTVVSLCYFVASWMLLGGSPGQRLMGIGVSSAATSAHLTVTQAFGRWVLLGAPLWILSTAMADEIGVLVSVASVAWVVFLLTTTVRSPMGQGVHDRWTGSIVTDVSRAADSRVALHLVKGDVR